MNQFLHFSGAGHQFLIAAERVVELYDADASPQPLDTVLSGTTGSVYWRDTLSHLMDIDELAGRSAAKHNRCFVVCRSREQSAGYFILRVKNIHELLTVDDHQLHPVNIAAPMLQNLAQAACIVPGSPDLYLLLHDFEDIFSHPDYALNLAEEKTD